MGCRFVLSEEVLGMIQVDKLVRVEPPTTQAVFVEEWA